MLARMGSSSGEWIYGRRPVAELLAAGRRHLYELVILPAAGGRDAPELAALRSQALARGLTVRPLGRAALDALCNGGHHQGVAARTGAFPYIALDQAIHDVRADPQALVLLLDHLEDPQNVGSLLRTAEAAGATAVILPEDRASGVTPAVVRASAGASEHLRVARVVNLARAMGALQEAGLWLAGLVPGEGARPCWEIDWRGRMGLVVGNEGAGLGRLVRERCDLLACLPMRGRVASLNAGVAGAIALFEALRQRAGPLPAKG
jgi:23S rRNA (guanosine2251-2'-O)-methyltransferase